MFFRPATTTPRQRRQGQISQGDQFVAYMGIHTLGGVLKALWSR